MICGGFIKLDYY